MTLVAPSILSADFNRLGEEIHSIEENGADLIHIDVMDGHFVPNLTMGPAIVKSIRPHTRLILDCHLMVEHPEEFIEQFHKAGADIITIHIESDTDHKKTIEQIHRFGMKAGISINPPTDIKSILPLLNDIDMILIMSVNPGFSGQSFIDITDKITVVKNELTRLGRNEVTIQVDGGINDKTAPLVVKAGADILVAASYIFGQDDYRRAIDVLKNA